MRRLITKDFSGFTLIELIVAIILLGMVVLTATTLELSLRKMNVKPEIQVRLLNELAPVVERIKNDFERQIGTQYNTSMYIETFGTQRRLSIRIDSDNSGTVTSGDAWHAYRWNGTAGNPIEYSPDNVTFNEILAYGITDFSISGNNTMVTVNIKTRKNPAVAENSFTNPGYNLTTTFYSRMASGS